MLEQHSVVDGASECMLPRHERADVRHDDVVRVLSRAVQHAHTRVLLQLRFVLEMLGPHALVEVAVHVGRVVEPEHAPRETLVVLQRQVVPEVTELHDGLVVEDGEALEDEEALAGQLQGRGGAGLGGRGVVGRGLVAGERVAHVAQHGLHVQRAEDVVVVVAAAEPGHRHVLGRVVRQEVLVLV
ncbi:unnamed protein product [Chrysodeixis includens]|uniref:Uncharacterized protein n=1 Tax=Chrysodeixis includens TaxID=689277 RepID=A0A9N8L5M1_CHRIL|nr:unnamed protein product [Chrysodeixis includens]